MTKAHCLQPQDDFLAMAANLVGSLKAIEKDISQTRDRFLAELADLHKQSKSDVEKQKEEELKTQIMQIRTEFEAYIKIMDGKIRDLYERFSDQLVSDGSLTKFQAKGGKHE